MTNAVRVVTEQIPGPTGPTGPAGPAQSPDITTDSSSFGAQWPVLSQVSRIQTADASPLTIIAKTPAASTAVDYIFSVLGKDRASGGIYRVDLRDAFSRDGSGATTRQGSQQRLNEIASGTMASATATIEVAGNEVRFRVQGIVGNVDWSVALQTQQVGVVV